MPESGRGEGRFGVGTEITSPPETGLWTLGPKADVPNFGYGWLGDITPVDHGFAFALVKLLLLGEAVEERSVNPHHRLLIDSAFPDAGHDRGRCLRLCPPKEVFRKLDVLPLTREDRRKLFLCRSEDRVTGVDRAIYHLDIFHRRRVLRGHPYRSLMSVGEFGPTPRAIADGDHAATAIVNHDPVGRAVRPEIDQAVGAVVAIWVLIANGLHI